MDVWRIIGPTIVTVDTLEFESRFDPVIVRFDVPEIHTEARVVADDQFDCTFVPPNNYRCPQLSVEEGLWEIGIAAYTGFPNHCADAALGRYSIDFGGRWAELVANVLHSDPEWFPAPATGVDALE